MTTPSQATLAAPLALDITHHTPLHTDGFPSQVKLILQMLRKLEHGALRMVMPDGQTALFGDHSTPISIVLKNWDVCNAALKSGDIGFAETYITGSWSSDNLPALIELFVHNREKVESAIYGTWWGNLFYRIKHGFQRNSRSGSRKNIHAHYDIGNDFYKLWLDPSMTYSSALFSGAPEQTLEQAQTEKYRRILSQLQVEDGASILEIGCGWGGFAEVAARAQGAKVTGLTLSSEQLHFANQRMTHAGLGALSDLQLKDYRDVHGQFDGIASIEMFEAVGEQYWPAYFQCIARNLKPQGRACIQSIVIADPLFQRYRKGTDFIQQYIFPGGMLPSPSAFCEQAQRHGLKVVDAHPFGLSYADTLALWRRSFNAQLDEIGTQGFDQRFVHTWEFYLAYCEAGFRAGSIDVMQFTLQKI
ncbi:cyclopropane-fatty-acyl-phospholipid synthase family protein [Herbaspirillum sp. RTI4]|uniref:cyclopropane-fatty-acyl-phospholipid synthase family protein n=1 Tax=Herbaspirillum sp. RTI4 TaxID=3048640 RepID=UPI002AB535E5|nr:cyclopropane-fatty-acyl-phospholipid synthase family protein [Herbaspirillum sp. RTI4]MDY7579481.1 cyclopropane-fatty-acyl-phospholipid synthase family protein [Herbaspirillum sp. RTI4]MEA9980395.1 cyclopropane-fatty-acyl-phospholipid synthase family protein [Herbaspirillum sp. RTI4]